MSTLDPASIYASLTRAGFTPAGAATMTAIAAAESGNNPAARGDLKLQDSTWGPSFGLFQIRTQRAKTGKGGDRDVTYLASSVDAQAKAAYNISQGGTDFTPWTTWKTKAYQQFLGTAVAASGGAVTAQQAFSFNPIDPLGVFPGLPNPLDLPKQAASELAKEAASVVLETVADSVVPAVKPIVVEGMFLVLGLGLVGAGLVRIFRPQIEATKSAVAKTAKVAATVAVL